MENGAETAVVIPFGRFMGNMLFSPICSDGEIELSIVRIIMPIGHHKQIAGPISDVIRNMELEASLQSELIRTSLNAKWPGKGGQNLGFPSEPVAALVAAAVLLVEGEGTEVLENKLLW